MENKQGGCKLEDCKQEDCKEVVHKLGVRSLVVERIEEERMQEVKEGSPSAQERERRPVSALLPQREWDFRDFREVWLHLHRRRLSSS